MGVGIGFEGFARGDKKKGEFLMGTRKRGKREREYFRRKDNSEAKTNPNTNISKIQIIRVEKVFTNLVRCLIRHNGRETIWMIPRDEVDGLEGKKEGDGGFYVETLARNTPLRDPGGALPSKTSGRYVR